MPAVTSRRGPAGCQAGDWVAVFVGGLPVVDAGGVTGGGDVDGGDDVAVQVAHGERGHCGGSAEWWLRGVGGGGESVAETGEVAGGDCEARAI